MNVFVTGATGFLGTAVAVALAQRGHRVAALARDPARGTPAAGVRFVTGELARPDGLDAAHDDLAETEVVVHLAAVRKDWALSEAQLRAINVASGPALLSTAPALRRFVFVSSVAVYGHSARGTRTSEQSPFAPSKRYGVSKVEAEAAIVAACKARNVACTIVRPGIVYGPGDTYGMVANLARLLAFKRFLKVGSGQSCVQLLYIDDLAEALVRAVEEPGTCSNDFILAGPQAIQIQRLVETVARAIPVSVSPVRIPELAARTCAWILERAHRLAGSTLEPFLTRSKIDLFTRDDLYDTTRAQTILGFTPRVGLDEGIPKAVAWLKDHGWAH